MGQLSEAFLQDYMSLPVRFHDFRNRAPQKYIRFLERWGTHYIKSASFGGKFTLLREATKSGSETEKEWESKMLQNVKKPCQPRQAAQTKTHGRRKDLMGYLDWEHLPVHLGIQEQEKQTLNPL